MKQLSVLNLHIQVNIFRFSMPLTVIARPLASTCHAAWKKEDRCEQRARRVATVEWTCAAIYHLSLSTCVGGPAAGIIAIWDQLTVIPSFCLCESSSSPPHADWHVFTRDDLQLWSAELGACPSSYCISLSARLELFSWWSEEASQSKPLRYLSGETKHKWILADTIMAVIRSSSRFQAF